MNNTVKKVAAVAAGVVTLLALTASSCDSSSNDAQERYSDQNGQRARAKWGDPNITNFAEYQLGKEVYELRDRQDLILFAYLQGNDGSLRCYGKVVGYGIPYATQLTPPDRPLSTGAQEPVREPNALFMPDSAEATWIRVVDPKTGKTFVDYVEPRLVVTPIERPCKPLDQ